MSKILLIFYLYKNPNQTVNTINNLLKNMSDKESYSIIVNIPSNSQLADNENLKIHLKKYKNLKINITDFSHQYNAIDKSLKAEDPSSFDILIPVTYIIDPETIKQDWDQKVRNIIQKKKKSLRFGPLLALLKEDYVKNDKVYVTSNYLDCKDVYSFLEEVDSFCETEDQVDFSYIICYRHSPDRLINLKKTISWLALFNCEVVLVEQDSEQRTEFPETYVNHIFTYTERPFNRSWSFNCGALNSKSDIIVFGDCDLVFDFTNFKDCIQHIKTSDVDCLSPFNKVIDLKRDECQGKDVDINSWKKIKRHGRGGVNLTGGVVIYTKDAFMKIGGWHEGFEGWGGEDDYMSIKSQHFLKCAAKPYTSYHIWHPSAMKEPQYYNENLRLLANVRKQSKEQLLQEIEKLRPTIGNIKKYK